MPLKPRPPDFEALSTFEKVTFFTGSAMIAWGMLDMSTLHSLPEYVDGLIVFTSIIPYALCAASLAFFPRS